MKHFFFHTNDGTHVVPYGEAQGSGTEDYAEHLKADSDELYGAVAIAFRLYGYRDMAAQVEHLADIGELPHYRRDGVLCMTVSALHRFIYHFWTAKADRELADV